MLIITNQCNWYGQASCSSAYDYDHQCKKNAIELLNTDGVACWVYVPIVHTHVCTCMCERDATIQLEIFARIMLCENNALRILSKTGSVNFYEN